MQNYAERGNQTGCRSVFQDGSEQTSREKLTEAWIRWVQNKEAREQESSS